MLIAVGHGNDSHDIKRRHEGPIALRLEIVFHGTYAACLLRIALLIIITPHLLHGRRRLERQVGELHHDDRKGIAAYAVDGSHATLAELAEAVARRGIACPAHGSPPPGGLQAQGREVGHLPIAARGVLTKASSVGRTQIVEMLVTHQFDPYNGAVGQGDIAPQPSAGRYAMGGLHGSHQQKQQEKLFHFK